MQALLDELKDCYRCLGNEIDEWKTTDLKYDYEGEEIDTVKEMEQLFWDVLTGDLKPGDLMATIDIKEILSPYLPADLVYPPEKFTVWVKVATSGYGLILPDRLRDFDLKFNLETQFRHLSIFQVHLFPWIPSITWKWASEGCGRYSWAMSMQVLGGYMDSHRLLLGVWLISGEEYSGQSWPV